VRPEAVQRLADDELMTLVQRRDPVAFEVFYDRQAGAAFSLAYRMVGDRAAAEDVVQESFLSIWRSRARYDSARGGVRAWTLSVVRNRAIDALRRGSLPSRRLDSDDDEVLAEQPAGERTEVEALRRETARELRGALAELPEEQSRVIELAFFGGFTHSEIARTLGMPLGTVKGRLRLGLEKVRASLAEAPA
jgi:RNA polymerase sigma-70 factor (ECF subfamily)